MQQIYQKADKKKEREGEMKDEEKQISEGGRDCMTHDRACETRVEDLSHVLRRQS